VNIAFVLPILQEHHIENRLMQTLVFLAINQGNAVTREQFFETVWKGLVVNEEALSRAISLLRTALGDSPHTPRYIQTIPGVGYRLIANIEQVGQKAEQPPIRSAVQENSIAVLPFVNLSDDPANEFFSDGISEEILNSLAQIKRFKVVGRTSSFAFKNKNEDLREIGAALNVSHVLEGSVRKAGASVRITVQLISTQDGYHLWSKTFDRSLDDIFAVQDEIASHTSNEMQSRLLGNPKSPQAIGGTENHEAYQAFLKGMHYRNRGALKETVSNAFSAFKEATRLDSNYARAFAALAFTLNDMIWNALISQEEGLKQMNQAAARAIDLAPELADGHLALGLSLQTGFQNKGPAEQAISRAMELNPVNPTVLIEYSRVCCNLGRHEASIESARKALELDPVSIYANHWMGHVLYFARRYKEAIEAFRKTLELDPHYPKPHYFIGCSYFFLGEQNRALEEVQLESLAWMRLTGLAIILHRMGRLEEAQIAYESLVELGLQDDVSVQQAYILAQRGEADLAFEQLNKAYELGDQGLTQLKITAFFDPIRHDARFDDLLQKLEFAE
jgi:TolB-like protein/tetratricopeptide (TPR) repeat protein